MAQHRQNTSVQQPFYLQLRAKLISGAKQRIRLVRRGLSKAQNDAKALRDAEILLEKVHFYTYNDECARSFLHTGTEIMQSVLTPTFHKAIEKIATN